MTPPALLARPDVPEDIAWYMGAFQFLGSSRRLGFGVGGIPLSEIVAYCELFIVPNPERFARIIRSLDTVYLEHEAQKHRDN